MSKFKDMNLKPYIQEALTEIHFKDLTDVQAQVLPEALKGNNLTVQSQTGSGKTHAFLIPIFQKLNENIDQVQAVITAPSRELATQLFEVASQIASFSRIPIDVVNYVGGTDKYRQIEQLAQQQPQIVIGTPGRIYDLMSENALWVQTARIMVVDEADMTMDLGFLSIVDEIASRMPEDLQFMVFSATIPQELRVFVDKYVTKPTEIVIEANQVISDYVENLLIQTRGRSRKKLAYQLLTLGHPFLALVFCNTRQYADEVSHYLQDKGLKVATVHGDITPRQRQRVMRQIRNLDYQYVVATDLAARGIDIPGTSLVINMEIPQDIEFFIHRVGRTGRNQQEGVAYTLVTPEDDELLDKLNERGVRFKAVDIINNEIKEVTSPTRRQDRKKATAVEEDPEIKRLVNRHKKRKVKPGYKRKLKHQIKNRRRQMSKEKQRQNRRRRR